MLIRLRGCAGWSTPVLFANPRRQVFSRRGPNKADLKRHKLMHTLSKFQCGICYERFSLAKLLKEHRLAHENEKRYSCSVRNKQLTTLRGLKLHKVVHSKEKLYGCPVCDKQFTQKGHIKNHLLIHSGEKPYKCQIAEEGLDNLVN